MAEKFHMDVAKKKKPTKIKQAIKQKCLPIEAHKQITATSNNEYSEVNSFPSDPPGRSMKTHFNFFIFIFFFLLWELLPLL